MVRLWRVTGTNRYCFPSPHPPESTSACSLGIVLWWHHPPTSGSPSEPESFKIIQVKYHSSSHEHASNVRSDAWVPKPTATAVKPKTLLWRRVAPTVKQVPRMPPPQLVMGSRPGRAQCDALSDFCCSDLFSPYYLDSPCRKPASGVTEEEEGEEEEKQEE